MGGSVLQHDHKKEHEQRAWDKMSCEAESL